MRLAPLLVALTVVAVPGTAAAQQEAVTGFHGYPWGTRGTGIAEIVQSPRVGDKDGLAIHSAELSFLGRDVLAGFYLHPETGALVEGAYIFSMGLDDCQATWDRALEALRGDYPGLKARVERTRREGRDLTVYANDCEAYVYNYRPEDGEWRAELTGSGPGTGRVLLRMHPVGRTLRVTVLFQGRAALAWAERDTGRV